MHNISSSPLFSGWLAWVGIGLGGSGKLPFTGEVGGLEQGQLVISVSHMNLVPIVLLLVRQSSAPGSVPAALVEGGAPSLPLGCRPASFQLLSSCCSLGAS